MVIYDAQSLDLCAQVIYSSKSSLCFMQSLLLFRAPNATSLLLEYPSPQRPFERGHHECDRILPSSFLDGLGLVFRAKIRSLGSSPMAELRFCFTSSWKRIGSAPKPECILEDGQSLEGRLHQRASTFFCFFVGTESIDRTSELKGMGECYCSIKILVQRRIELLFRILVRVSIRFGHLLHGFGKAFRFSDPLRARAFSLAS